MPSARPPTEPLNGAGERKDRWLHSRFLQIQITDTNTTTNTKTTTNTNTTANTYTRTNTNLKKNYLDRLSEMEDSWLHARFL